MKLEEGDLVQWTRYGQHFTGRMMLSNGEPVVIGEIFDLLLVKHSYTGELFVIDSASLSPYPSSPIPEPTK